MATVANGAGDEGKDTVVKEIPPALDKLLLLMVKNFYSAEQCLLVYYIMRAVCIKEEKLRERVQFEHKQMREWMAQLKKDKVVRERLITQKNENNRSINMIFYFINYRALANVLTFKIDHMRQRLEAREKDTVQKAHYKCTKCSMQYETIDMDRIFDPFTQTLVCWRCKGEVELDESAGPTNETRSLLARFNEQMLPMFTVIRELAGIQLAPHLYEPDINKYIDDPAAQQPQVQQHVDFSQPASRAQLGGVAFKREMANKSALLNTEQITVEINSGPNIAIEEQKEVPAWLAQPGMAGTSATSGGYENDPLSPTGKQAPTVDLSMLAELEGLNEETEPETTEQPSSATADEAPDTAAAEADGSVDNEEDEWEDEPMVTVQGESHPISQVINQPELVEQMTDAEKEAYISAYEAYSEM
ncbi:unnamed protein product, partial [Mesorhabditis spiculigera]